MLTCAAQYVEMPLEVALRMSPRVANAAMSANPIDRSHNCKIFARGMYTAAPIAAVTIEMTGRSECSAKALVM